MQNDEDANHKVSLNPSVFFRTPKKRAAKRSFSEIGGQENRLFNDAEEVNKTNECAVGNVSCPPSKLSCIDENNDSESLASSSKQESRKFVESENNKRNTMTAVLNNQSSTVTVGNDRSNTRKRSFVNSFGANGGGNRRPDSLYFLMGGNIRDPLNLKSVKPEDPTRGLASEKPIEMIVPKNVHDPLNLLNMPSLEQSSSRKKKKKKRNQNLKDMIVSPAVCQRRFPLRFNKKVLFRDEGVSKSIDHNVTASKGNVVLVDHASTSNEKKDELAAKHDEKQRLINMKYCYGNYNQYRNRVLTSSGLIGSGASDPSLLFDARTRIFCEDWFQNKQVLDIGCSAGVFTLSIAQLFNLRRIVGVDIDSYLIGAARKNLRHFADRHAKISSKFPASFGLNFGPISTTSTIVSSDDFENGKRFPDNVLFRTENYVLESDELLESSKSDLYDIVMAISLVKWVHLNWGDAGLKRFFRRVFREMRTGGRFIVEIEGVDAYRKIQRKHRMTQKMLENLELMTMFPDDFCAYLLSDEVGFKHHETLDTPLAHTFGWSGRLHVFYKGEFMIPQSFSTITKLADVVEVDSVDQAAV